MRREDSGIKYLHKRVDAFVTMNTSHALYFMPHKGQENIQQQWASAESTHPATDPSSAVPAAAMSSAPLDDWLSLLSLFFFFFLVVVAGAMAAPGAAPSLEASSFLFFFLVLAFAHLGSSVVAGSAVTPAVMLGFSVAGSGLGAAAVVGGGLGADWGSR